MEYVLLTTEDKETLLAMCLCGATECRNVEAAGTMGWRAEYQENEPREIGDEDRKEGLRTGKQGGWGLGDKGMELREMGVQHGNLEKKVLWN